MRRACLAVSALVLAAGAATACGAGRAGDRERHSTASRTAVSAPSATAPAARRVVMVAPRAVPRPRILQRRIAYGPRRLREMRSYARRHYGLDTWRLRRPRVIVEHYTGSTALASTLATFAADVPDVELHELPGVCSHFVIDRDGAIYQLVSTRIMCRHTVGLNWAAIGVEHVGLSDAQILGDRRQLRASLRLTRWLRCRYGIRLRDVIGHAESLRSPYHRERVARLRDQTHGDMGAAAMGSYRRRLGRLGCSERAAG